MAGSTDQNPTFKSDSINTCCEHWKKKYSKVQESRNALRQAVKVLEHKIIEIQAQDKKACAEKVETEGKFEEFDNARVALENEKVKGFQACIADRDKAICRLKELLESEKRRADSERQKGAEAYKLLEEEKNKASEAYKLLEEQKNKDAEAYRLLEEEKSKAAEKGMQIARIEAQKAEEYRIQIDRLEKQVNEVKIKLVSEMSTFKKEKKQFETEKGKILAEKRNAELAMVKANEMLEVEKNKAIEAEKAEEYRIQVGRLEKQVNEAKTKLVSEMSTFKKEKKQFETEKRKILAEKRNAELGMVKANEMLEVEKNKAIEAEKAEGYRIQVGRLEKQLNEAKTKLVSEMSTFKKEKNQFEAEKRKILAEKRNAELGMAKANEMLEVEKQKVIEEKKRADAEMVKLEEQKALTEDNWNKFMGEKSLTDKMSRRVEEDKRTIEDLKQKMLELSSLRKPIEMEADASLKAESTKVKLLKKQMKLEKLRAKNARQKYKLEASRYGILRHELGRLKIDFIHLLHRLDMLDASFPPVAGSINDQKKSENTLHMQNSNVMRQAGNLNLSQVHSQFENELLEPCCTTMDAHDPLRKNTQHNPLLALSGGNYSESITGIDSKLEPLVRGSNKTKLQSSAVNSSTESISDGQLMGSQETTVFPVTASATLTQEIFNARQSFCNPSDRSVPMHHRKRKKVRDTVEYIANLSSENLSDLHAFLCVDKCLGGGSEMLHNLNNFQEKNNRAHKTRKKSHGGKVDMIPWISRDEKKSIEEANIEVNDDANLCICPTSYTIENTQACEERICDAANNLDSVISFDKVADGGIMKLLELENAADEECYRRAMDFPLSPSLPEIEFHETCDADNLMSPFLEAALQGDMSSRIDLFPSPNFDVINVEINSNEQKIDLSGVSSNSQNKITQDRKTEVVTLPHMHTPEKSSTAFLVEDGIGSLHNQLPKFCVVFSNLEDNSVLSRIIMATKNCIARCHLATQTGWAVSNILTALKMEEKLSQKEKVSVLLTLLLFNFILTATKTFGNLWDGNLLRCLNSYSEHIQTAMSDAETKILFLENYSLHELLGLIEEFLIEGKVLVNNAVPAETLSDFVDCVDKVSPGVASTEQLVAGSIILASVCAATDHVGFICEASYDILRLCKWDSSMVLIILHIFSYLGGENFFNLDNFGLMVTVLKSIVMFLEDGSPSVVNASCLPSINQLHTEFCLNITCPFLEGAESIDVVACLLLEEIKSCWLQGIIQADLSDSGFMLDRYNAVQLSNQEAVQCAISKYNDAPCCLKKYSSSATQPDALKNGSFCHLCDILSLVELVANQMSWHWTDIKLIPQLLKMLDSCVEEKVAIAIIVLLGQLGRIGVDVGGYDDRGVENLRCNLLAYLCCTSSKKASLSLQIATATTLFGLLPLDLETLFHTNSSLSAHTKSVSDNAETLRKWFSGLSKDQQILLSDILKCIDVDNKQKFYQYFHNI